MDQAPINQQLIQEMVARELAKPQPAVQKPLDLGIEKGFSPTSISPELLHTIGGLSDAAGTYFGLKNNVAREGNPLLNKGGAATAGLGLLGQLGVSKGLTHLVRKFNPGLADALAANIGARQLGLGADWASHMDGTPVTQSGNDNYTFSLLRGLNQTNGR